jgi:sugar phosphate isomerase/epimerase
MGLSAMQSRRLCLSLSVLTVAAFLLPARGQGAEPGLYDRENLVAWCIVPFDAKKRGPEERAAMLERLGIKQLAYDWRGEHIATFDAELDALKRHDIKLTAFWFPDNLGAEAQAILSVLKRHKVQTQLWMCSGIGPANASPEEHRRAVDAAVARIRPIAEAAGKIGCSVELYNHGGWFGQPENMVEIVKQLNMPNVGIVYNLHHGHDHLDRFPKALKLMMPYLHALNLNGMAKDGERRGLKIMPIGQGELDLGLLKTIRESGYRGPIGILNHTDADAEARLHDNRDGLEWLVPQLDGKEPGPKPTPRSWTHP